MHLTMQNGVGVEISDAVFSVDYQEALIHQVVVAYMNSARAGTKAQKNRSAVRGGGIKPFRQKGTGRARQGTIRSPIMRTGGVTFAATPRSYQQKVNRKMYRGALRSIFSELIRQERLIIVEDFLLEQPKTKHLLTKLNQLSADLNDVLLVVEYQDENLILASRNLYQVDVCSVDNIDPVSLIGFDKVIIISSALRKLEKRLL